MHLSWPHINIQLPLLIKLTIIQNELYIICFLTINVIFNRIKKTYPKSFWDTEEREGLWLHVSKNTDGHSVLLFWYVTE